MEPFDLGTGNVDFIAILKFLGALATFIGVLFGFAWTSWHKIEKKFSEMNTNRMTDVEERNAKLDSLEDEAVARHRQLEEDLHKSRQDVTQLRNDMQLRLANMVSLDKLEAVLDRRIGGVEGKLDRFEVQLGALIVELARLGVKTQNQTFPRLPRSPTEDHD